MLKTPTVPLRFSKMHALGNDFVVIDARSGGTIAPEVVRLLGDRHRGVGFDTLALIGPSETGEASLAFWNADGSAAAACGNATRCVARVLMEESGADRVVIQGPAGPLDCRRAGDEVSVNMGPPVLDWTRIPLAREVNLDALPLPGGPSAVGMGNPHCVFFVDDADSVDPSVEGPVFETDPLYPDRTNVEFVSLLATDHLRMRVWERGGMATLACGSGACAALVAAHRRGLTGRRARITLDGGDLTIDWRADGVWMTGPATHVFDAVLSPEMQP